MKYDYNTRLLAKILGELYRMQDRGAHDSAHIYGLRRGFEDSIDFELETGLVNGISNDELDSVSRILESIWTNDAERQQFAGYYDIEKKLEHAGIDRAKAMTILRFLYANGQFTDLIRKLDSQNSPIECKRFELDENGD